MRRSRKPSPTWVNTRTRHWQSTWQTNCEHICEPDDLYRRWTDKPDEYESTYQANQRRLKGDRNKRLQKLRCERVERSFAHVCETGGARRTLTTPQTLIRCE